MIELPEAITLAKQLDETVRGKAVRLVLPPSKPHKFCWFNGDPSDYGARLKNARAVSAAAFGMYAELRFDNGARLCVNDGVNVRLTRGDALPGGCQLAVCFDDGDALAFTVAMYGGIILHDGAYDNEYYLKSAAAVSPLDSGFDAVFVQRLAECKPTLSAKAFIATAQRFPGIGNGVAQDVLFAAGLHPKRKLSTLCADDAGRLQSAIVSVAREMTGRGGRDTEKDLFGRAGGYVTKMSKNGMARGCPVCGGAITKENYLGGSVYYCPVCQR